MVSFTQHIFIKLQFFVSLCCRHWGNKIGPKFLPSKKSKTSLCLSFFLSELFSPPESSFRFYYWVSVWMAGVLQKLTNSLHQFLKLLTMNSVFFISFGTAKIGSILGSIHSILPASFMSQSFHMYCYPSLIALNRSSLF